MVVGALGRQQMTGGREGGFLRGEGRKPSLVFVAFQTHQRLGVLLRVLHPASGAKAGAERERAGERPQGKGRERQGLPVWYRSTDEGVRPLLLCCERRGDMGKRNEWWLDVTCVHGWLSVCCVCVFGRYVQRLGARS